MKALIVNAIVFQTAAMSALALGWTVFMPVLMMLSKRWDGFSDEQASTSVTAGCSAHV